MFITRNDCKSTAPGLLLEDGDTGWSAAELPQRQTWFLVHYGKIDADRDPEFAWSNTILLFDFLSVEDFLQSSQDSNMRLISVHIVTPAHVNGSNFWKMDQLRAVWKSNNLIEENTSTTSILETTTGEKYCASSTGWYKKEMVTETLQFEFSH